MSDDYVFPSNDDANYEETVDRLSQLLDTVPISRTYLVFLVRRSLSSRTKCKLDPMHVDLVSTLESWLGPRLADQLRAYATLQRQTLHLMEKNARNSYMAEELDAVRDEDAYLESILQAARALAPPSPALVKAAEDELEEQISRQASVLGVEVPTFDAPAPAPAPAPVVPPAIGGSRADILAQIGSYQPPEAPLPLLSAASVTLPYSIRPLQAEDSVFSLPGVKTALANTSDVILKAVATSETERWTLLTHIRRLEGLLVRTVPCELLRRDKEAAVVAAERDRCRRDANKMQLALQNIGQTREPSPEPAPAPAPAPAKNTRTVTFTNSVSVQTDAIQDARDELPSVLAHHLEPLRQAATAADTRAAAAAAAAARAQSALTAHSQALTAVANAAGVAAEGDADLVAARTIERIGVMRALALTLAPGDAARLTAAVGKVRKCADNLKHDVREISDSFGEMISDSKDAVTDVLTMLTRIAPNTQGNNDTLEFSLSEPGTGDLPELNLGEGLYSHTPATTAPAPAPGAPAAAAAAAAAAAPAPPPAAAHAPVHAAALTASVAQSLETSLPRLLVAVAVTNGDNGYVLPARAGGIDPTVVLSVNSPDVIYERVGVDTRTFHFHAASRASPASPSLSEVGTFLLGDIRRVTAVGSSLTLLLYGPRNSGKGATIIAPNDDSPPNLLEILVDEITTSLHGNDKMLISLVAGPGPLTDVLAGGNPTTGLPAITTPPKTPFGTNCTRVEIENGAADLRRLCRHFAPQLLPPPGVASALHAVLTVHVPGGGQLHAVLLADSDLSIREAKGVLAPLAGARDAKGVRLASQGLSAVSDVCAAIAGGNTTPPFRNSLLTKQLAPVLGANRVILIGHVSSVSALEELSQPRGGDFIGLRDATPNTLAHCERLRSQCRVRRNNN